MVIHLIAINLQIYIIPLTYPNNLVKKYLHLFSLLIFIPAACYAYVVGENTIRQAKESYGL